MIKDISFVKGEKFSALNIKVSSKKINKYEERKFLNIELRKNKGKNNNGNAIFEKDKKSNGFHIFGLNSQEALSIASVLDIIVSKVLLNKKELEVILSPFVQKKDNIFYEKGNMLFIQTSLVHTTTNKEGKEISKSLNISYNFRKEGKDSNGVEKYSIQGIKISSTQKGEKLETMLNIQDIYVIINLFKKFAL